MARTIMIKGPGCQVLRYQVQFQRTPHSRILTMPYSKNIRSSIIFSGLAIRYNGWIRIFAYIYRPTRLYGLGVHDSDQITSYSTKHFDLKTSKYPKDAQINKKIDTKPCANMVADCKFFLPFNFFQYLPIPTGVKIFLNHA